MSFIKKKVIETMMKRVTTMKPTRLIKYFSILAPPDKTDFSVYFDIFLSVKKRVYSENTLSFL
ncbi:hypothetical protein ShirakiTA10_10620 [Bacillus safensis]|nr:hypothetical protein ShirakiTA10_10620 [Bacillus safensis]